MDGRRRCEPSYATCLNYFPSSAIAPLRLIRFRVGWLVRLFRYEVPRVDFKGSVFVSVWPHFAVGMYFACVEHIGQRPPLRRLPAHTHIRMWAQMTWPIRSRRLEKSRRPAQHNTTQYALYEGHSRRGVRARGPRQQLREWDHRECTNTCTVGSVDRSELGVASGQALGHGQCIPKEIIRQTVISRF